MTAPSDRAAVIAARVEAFVREVVAPYERDPRCGAHGPSDELVAELRGLARAADIVTPHILADGSHLDQRETAYVLQRSGLSPLGPIAVNTAAPDEGNMYLLGKVGSADQKRRFLDPLVRGEARSAFFMTEPASEGGAGSDPSMMQTTALMDGNHWVVNGRKTFITGADGAQIGIVMAKSDEGACIFLVDLPDPAIIIERVLDTIDSSMPGGHAIVRIDNLRIPADQMLGNSGEGFHYAQIRLAPARLSSRRGGLHARRESDRPETGRVDDRLVRRRARHWGARRRREFDDQGLRLGKSDADCRPLRSGDGRDGRLR
jgi:acyl-CoA dehydrogenase